RVPLTLEDTVHPQEGDFIPERDDHELDCSYLAGVARARSPGPPHVRVTRDMLIDWGVPDQRNTSPDIAVFVGLPEPPTVGNGTFYLKPSGGRCLMVVEVVSPDRRDNDLVRKPPEYHAAGVPLYVLIDQERPFGQRTLRAFRWEQQGYVPLDL